MKAERIITLVILAIISLMTVTPLAAQEKAAGPSYLFRLDYHFGEINPWLFYEKPIAKNIGLSAVFQMSSQGYAQIDLGPAFHFGNLVLIPEFGMEFVEAGEKGARIGHVCPEFFVFYNGPQWTFESQNLYFAKIAEETYPAQYYYRHYLGHRLYQSSFVGPQVEGYVFPDSTPDHYFGGHLDIDIGAGLIGLFYGQNRDERGIFRMTFLRGF